MGEGDRKMSLRHPRGSNVITGPVKVGKGVGRGGWSGVTPRAQRSCQADGPQARNAEASRSWQREGEGASGKECSPPHTLTVAQ